MPLPPEPAKPSNMADLFAAEPHWFVAGTDTNVGKTYATCQVLALLRSMGKSAVGYKPVCSGGREDAYFLQNASFPMPELDDVNPVWFRAPLARMQLL